jgi:tape measure domain-containing protein
MATTLADLVVQIQAKGVEAVQAATGRVRAALNSVQRVQPGVDLAGTARALGHAEATFGRFAGTARSAIASAAGGFHVLPVAAGRAASGIGSAFSGIVSPVRGALSQIGSLFSSILSWQGLLVAGIASLGLSLKSMISSAAELETMSVSFEVLLGSAEKAKKLIADINKFAAETPFEQMQVAGVAKQLLAAGFAAEDVIEITRMLGDIAALSGARVEDLAFAFGKVRQMGRLTAEVFQSFATRGVPLARELARQFGVSEEQVRELMSQGKIGFADVAKALQSLTDQGGQFAGGMQRLSQTTAGLWSTLTGNIKQFMAETGLAIIEMFGIKDAIAAVASMFDGLGGRVAVALGTVREMFASVFGRLREVFGPILEQIMPLLAGWWEGIKDAAVATWEGLKSLFSGLATALKQVLTSAQEFINWIGPILQQAWQTSVALITAGIELIGSWFATLAEWIAAAWNAVTEGTKRAIDWILGLFGATTDTVQSTVVEWLANLQFFAENWRLYFQLAWEHVKLFFQNLPEYAKTAFANAVELVRWFADNWRDILQTAFNFVKTMFMNLTENLKRLWDALVDFMMGRGFNFEWKPLLDGFENTIKEMPKLMEANVERSNEAIQRLEAELARKREEFDRRRQLRAEEGRRAEEAAPPPAPPERRRLQFGGAAKAAEVKIEFVGFADLAKKMQEAAGQKMQEQMLKAQQQAANGIAALAGAVAGGAIRVVVQEGPPPRFG